MNLVDEQIEVYRAPSGAEFTVRSVHRRGDWLTPPAFPDVVVGVEEILA